MLAALTFVLMVAFLSSLLFLGAWWMIVPRRRATLVVVLTDARPACTVLVNGEHCGEPCLVTLPGACCYDHAVQCDCGEPADPRIGMCRSCAEHPTRQRRTHE